MDFNWITPPPLFSDKVKHLQAFYNTDSVLKNYPSLGPVKGNFSDSRKAEYIAGRFCAIKALTAKGIKVDNILSNEDRTPVWPKNTLGSITHSKNLVSVAVSTDKNIKSIGHDCEFIVSPTLAREMIDSVLPESEKDLIVGEIQEFFTLAYSAKESFFKAIYPLTKQFFSFEHAQILEIDFNEKTFKIKAIRDFEKSIIGGEAFTGTFSISHEIVHTGLEIFS